MGALDVDVGAVRGAYVRHIPHGADPLYRSPDPADNRWQRGKAVDAWYFADEPDTAWAEWYRSLAGTGLPPEMALPRDLWTWQIDLKNVALLDTDERLVRVGLPALAPTADQWPACQKVGEALLAEGLTALLVASAARRGSRNLVVFRSSRTVPGCDPVPPPAVTTRTPPVPRGLRT